MSEEALTFSELRKIQKTERRQEELSELDQDFFLKVGDYLQRKKELSDDKREYKNAKRVFRKILSLREDKIVKNSRLSLKSNIKASELNTLPREEQLFREMKQKFNEHRDRIDEVIEGQKVETSTRTEETKQETQEENENKDNSEKEEDQETEETSEEKGEQDSDPEEGYKVVEITAEVPEFMGTDLEAYGPFEEGDEAEIPEDNAEILVNRGNAEPVS